ncbi:hypothetical protein AB0K14_31090 [Actinosynnema sp. NPDC050801]|uniref:hypothetical protein n=1 Tax=unclassified Actinosynnema TaxID=2637065 RepID=UPI0033C9A4D6
MLDGFVAFLDDYLADRGFHGLLKAGLGILAFGSVLSAAFGSVAVKAAGLTIAALYVLGSLILLARGQAVLRRKVERREGLLTYYCDLIYEEIHPLWRIDRWEEDVDVAKNGDVTASIVVHAMAQRDELRFFRVRLGSKWDQPMSSRRKVRVSVSSIEVDGTGGTRYERTSNWLPDGRLEILVHLRSTLLKKGDEVRLRLDVVWPQKAAPLMRFGEPDEFVMRVGNPLAYVSYRVAFPAGFDVRCDVIGLHRGDNYTLTTSSSTGNRAIVQLQAQDVGADRSFGMRLDLR